MSIVPKLTKPIGYCAVLVILILAIEAGVQAWRHVGLASSTAPVFYWKESPLLSTAPPPFGKALEAYRADRGAEQTQELPEGRKLTLFYFEWDRIELGPFCGVNGHEVQICNVEHGSFKLLQGGGQRIFTAANGEKLYFNFTLLADPCGKTVYIYKLPWVQGFGAWQATDSGRDRTFRLRRSFIRYCGAARVIQAGIFNAASEDEAWDLFQREALDKLQWNSR